MVLDGDFREITGFEAAATLLDRRPRPTAVFAANDSMAIGLLAALDGVGCRVPDDMAVVGFDDVAIAGYLNPPLTTVHVDACGLGSQAVEMMLEDMKAGTRTGARADGDSGGSQDQAAPAGRPWDGWADQQYGAA